MAHYGKVLAWARARRVLERLGGDGNAVDEGGGGLERRVDMGGGDSGVAPWHQRYSGDNLLSVLAMEDRVEVGKTMTSIWEEG